MAPLRLSRLLRVSLWPTRQRNPPGTHHGWNWTCAETFSDRAALGTPTPAASHTRKTTLCSSRKWPAVTTSSRWAHRVLIHQLFFFAGRKGILTTVACTRSKGGYFDRLQCSGCLSRTVLPRREFSCPTVIDASSRSLMSKSLSNKF